MIFELLFNSETTSGTVVVLDSCMCLEFKNQDKHNELFGIRNEILFHPGFF
jgi:hypothetical protein